MLAGSLRGRRIGPRLGVCVEGRPFTVIDWRGGAGIFRRTRSGRSARPLHSPAAGANECRRGFAVASVAFAMASRDRPGVMPSSSTSATRSAVSQCTDLAATEGTLSPVDLRKHVAFMDLVNSNHQRNEQGRLPAKGIDEIRLERNPCTSTTTELLSCRSRRGPLWMAKGWACHKERSTF
jgi:hypothetical protein